MKRFVKVLSSGATLIIVGSGTFVYFNNRPEYNAGQDLAAIHAMGIVTGQSTDELREQYVSRYNFGSQTITTARKSKTALDAIINHRDWSLPEPDAREFLATYLTKDLDHLQDQREMIHKYYSDQGFWQDIKNKTIEPGIFRQFVNRDIHIWRGVFERLPKGRVDWRTAFKTAHAVYNEYPLDPKYKDFDSEVTQAAADITQYGLLECDRHLHLTAAHIYLDALKTGALPKTLPDYGPISREPFNGKPLSYKRTATGFDLGTIGPYGGGKNGSQHSEGYPYP